MATFCLHTSDAEWPTTYLILSFWKTASPWCILNMQYAKYAGSWRACVYIAAERGGKKHDCHFPVSNLWLVDLTWPRKHSDLQFACEVQASIQTEISPPNSLVRVGLAQARPNDSIRGMSPTAGLPVSIGENVTCAGNGPPLKLTRNMFVVLSDVRWRQQPCQQWHICKI